jgi:hypothetical protein
VKGNLKYPKPINYREGDLKHSAGNAIKAVMTNFYFQSFGKYRTLLEMFNLTAGKSQGDA